MTETWEKGKATHSYYCNRFLFATSSRDSDGSMPSNEAIVLKGIIAMNRNDSFLTHDCCGAL